QVESEENIESPNVPKWVQIKVDLNGQKIAGFVAKSFLAKSAPNPAPQKVNAIDFPIHLNENNPEVTLSSFQRAYPIGSPDRPVHPENPSSEDIKNFLHTIAEFLNVENNPRYKRTVNATYCNIYAYDFCYLVGAYLPRIWWDEGSIIKLWLKEKVTPIYGNTLFELNANALFNWLNGFSKLFGWKRVYFESQLQAEVNQGKIGLICAKRIDTNKSGHITVVVPETDDHQALRGDDRFIPLQSQAGASNRAYFADINGSAWYRHPRYQEFGFWVYELAK
ncbi:MAG: hypothetical protein AAF242_19305, partial [Bacteroidota bacterium]